MYFVERIFLGRDVAGERQCRRQANHQYSFDPEPVTCQVQAVLTASADAFDWNLGHLSIHPKIGGDINTITRWLASRTGHHFVSVKADS
jgi:hypothetical protein